MSDWIPAEDAEKIRQHVRYDPDTGELICIKRWHTVKVDDVMGTLCSNHIYARMFNYQAYVHQWAYWFMTGEVPDEIDHKNRIGTDNRWDNLRSATRTQNQANAVARKGKYRGVHRHTYTPKWVATVTHYGHKIYLGLYENEEDAARAYNAAALNIFGEFACLNNVEEKHGD